MQCRSSTSKVSCRDYLTEIDKTNKFSRKKFDSNFIRYNDPPDRLIKEYTKDLEKMNDHLFRKLIPAKTRLPFMIEEQQNLYDTKIDKGKPIKVMASVASSPEHNYIKRTPSSTMVSSQPLKVSKKRLGLNPSTNCINSEYEIRDIDKRILEMKKRLKTKFNVINIKEKENENRHSSNYKPKLNKERRICSSHSVKVILEDRCHNTDGNYEIGRAHV